MEHGFFCPTCGAAVPERAKACPECGADEKTGWSPDTMYDGLDLPDPEESGTGSSGRGRRWLLVVAAIAGLAAMLWLLFRQG